MSAFLFLRAAAGAGTQRRVDFANIASLFAEIEEPAASRGDGRIVARVMALLLILLIAVGDIVLVARPDAAAYAPPVAAPHGSAVTQI
ncbi:protein of unknown function [Beijerinckiaceae bacterium RH AL1]|nr:hypothetical protein [Beijerinckiaceae bacterium]VVB47378.1 protein of unknown function [Beijerinckiaceae bacterium RH CH11]VVB47460.1 protein of unknown function [Beijerinckiaceae bacterium RH AL8]VVC55857.1 protein of unknown function [Beijerinckiaceae bacterium RH AL1]